MPIVMIPMVPALSERASVIGSLTAVSVCTHEFLYQGPTGIGGRTYHLSDCSPERLAL